MQLRATDSSPTPVQYFLRVTGGAGDGVERMVAASSTVNTSAVDNGATYTLSARAVDSAGNAGASVATTVVVDRVRPTATFNIANMSRLTPTRLEVTFSEPMAPSNASLVLNPAASSSLTGSTAVAPTLENYTVYTTAVAAALTDVAGNPVTPPSSIRFSTEVKLPDPNVPLLSGSVSTFDAVSDQDGVVLVASWQASQTGVNLRIVGLDPRTVQIPNSSLVIEPNINAGLASGFFPARDVELQSFRFMNPDLTIVSRQGGSFTQANLTARTIFAFENATPMAGAGLFADHHGVFMSPPLPGESPRPFASVRYVGPSLYINRGTDLSFPFEFSLVALASTGQWRTVTYPRAGGVIGLGQSSMGCVGANCPYNPASSQSAGLVFGDYEGDGGVNSNLLINRWLFSAAVTQMVAVSRSVECQLVD